MGRRGRLIRVHPCEPEPVRPSLTADLARFRAASDAGPLRLSDVLGGAGDRGFALVLLLASVPFVLPFPTLGLATPVGFALALAALGLVVGRPAVLPPSLGALAISPAALARASSVVSRAAWVLTRVARPRMAFMMKRSMRIALGVSLFVAAVVLGMPIPLPFSNFFPAVAIILLAVGVLEGDGLLVAAGHTATLGVSAIVAASGTTVVAVASRLAGRFL
jgi:hypothetical protein